MQNYKRITNKTSKTKIPENIFSELDVERRELYWNRPRLKRRYLIISLVVIVALLVFLGIILGRDLITTKKERQRPPNPTKALPPSSSTLHRFKKAAVCADGAPCAEIGKQILEDNGTAVDATIATMFCNGIFTMQSMGLGGGFLMTIYIHKNKTAYALNAREKAPLAATLDMYKNDTKKSQNGPLSIGVPGELRGYWEAHKRFGKLPWKDLIDPSVKLCENGYTMSQHQYDALHKNTLHADENFEKWFKEPDGKYKKAGSKIVPNKLCETLKVISKNGGDDLYNGTLAKKLVEDIKSFGGIITEKDLESYTAEWIAPVSMGFNDGSRLYSVPPPGSGLILGLILNILDGYNFSQASIEDDENTIVTFHRIIEAFKYAYAMRTELGDTAFVNITDLIGNLTSRSYADNIRAQINDNSTSADPKHYGAVVYNKVDHGTSHVSVLSENGDAVSVTSSVNIYFGAGKTSTQTGIILNSVMDDFSYPFYKNYFGLPGSPNNEMQPGKRPLSSMSPSIIVNKDGDVRLVVGASGGTKITTAVALVIMRLIWFQQNIKEAVDAPRIHHQLFPMEVQYEYGALQQLLNGLEAIGHKMQLTLPNSIVCALFVQNGSIFANADYRKGGDVYGVN